MTMAVFDFNSGKLRDFVPVELRSLPLDVRLECGVFNKKSASADEKDDYSLLCEDQTITQTLLDRLGRTLFPETKVHIDRQYVIGSLFAHGHFLGFSQQEVLSIRNGESFWIDTSSRAEISPAAPVAVAAPKPEPEPAEKPEPKAALKTAKTYSEIVKEYEDTKVIVDQLIKDVAKEGKVDKEQGTAIAEDIQQQINSADTTLIFQTMNRVRNEDEYLLTHSLNVAFLNGLIGKLMKLSPTKQFELVEVGMLHDVGKLKIDPAILNKPGKLTKEEFDEIKKHPALSLEVLLKSGIRNQSVLEGVVQHHEKVNGTGYPKNLDAHEICEFARITAISDIYDAMVAKRVYKEACSPFVILNEFGKGGYSELDIKYVNIFIECMIEELKGKEVIMSDGREATVLLVRPRQLLYPIVEIEGKAITTDEELYCVNIKVS